MAKPPLTKNLVRNRLATVELALSKLDTDYQEATYRQNPLVANCIKSAREELESAFESLFNENLQTAFDLAAIAWLHTDFGRQVIDAEVIEHILGESDYLELSEIGIPWENKAKHHFSVLEQELQRIRAEVKGSSGSK